jgi:hypothetical protein
MISQSNVDVLEVLRKFRLAGIEVAFLVPTETGLAKSIMDATEAVRDFLRKTRLHDFDNQPQGPEHKRLLPTKVITGSGVIATETSLYRPVTKTGDPRLWIYGLKEQARQGDLLALVEGVEGLTVINCSTANLDGLLSQEAAPSIREPFQSDFWRPFVAPPIANSLVFEELLEKLRAISAMGYVGTLRPGDTGVGFTLESLLGISANSSKAPDYQGIEIKSGRESGTRAQSTVFSQVPNWAISRLKGSKEILRARGRISPKTGKLKLFHEISAKCANSYGLKLAFDDSMELMHQVYIEGDLSETDVTWAVEKLKQRLLEKHKESVWVTALCSGKLENEAFWYRRVKHTQKVDPNALPILLETGAITVHYTIKELPNGSAKDQGYLFKTAPKHLDLLFSKVEHHEFNH